MKIEELQNLLDDFLERWSLETVQNMSLSEYVGIGNQDTFCQWVETKTRSLGSIKGLTSIKFGIYERRNTDKKPKNYANDDRYSWLQGYGSNRNEAFTNVKQDILRIIKAIEIGDLKEIDRIPLPDLFKWKVAFLYSNKRLIPIYKREVLHIIAKSLGLTVDKNTLISDIQQLMIQNKPTHLDVYSYMRLLYDKYGRGIDKEIEEEINSTNNSERKKRGRKPTETKNTNTQVRTIVRSYIVTQRHNKLQEALKNKLIKEFGKEAVLLEENYVDIKLLQPDSIVFYEVKSSPYAGDCIREALGQILSYTFNDVDKRKKKITIVGQYPPNKDEIEFIKYLKMNIKIDFDYENIDIE